MLTHAKSCIRDVKGNCGKCTAWLVVYQLEQFVYIFDSYYSYIIGQEVLVIQLVNTYCWFTANCLFSTTVERVFFAPVFFPRSFRAVLFSRFLFYLLFIIGNISYSRSFIFVIFFKSRKTRKYKWCEKIRSIVLYKKMWHWFFFIVEHF